MPVFPSLCVRRDGMVMASKGLLAAFWPIWPMPVQFDVAHGPVRPGVPQLYPFIGSEGGDEVAIAP